MSSRLASPRRAAGLGPAGVRRSEPAPELGVGAVSACFRVDLQVSPEIDHREQQVAELVFERGTVRRSSSFLQFSLISSAILSSTVA